MNEHNKLENRNVTIPTEAFYGKRRTYPEESAYVKGLMLSYYSKSVNVIFWIIVGAMIVLPLYGAKKLLDVIRYSIIRLQFSDIAVESVICVLLVAIAICGIKVMWNELRNVGKNTVKVDLLNDRFCVVDVEIVAYHQSNNMESSESLATVRDCNGNIADQTFTTSNWQEIDKTKTGLVVITGDERKKTVLYRVIPRYNVDSAFCQKYRNAYLQKYGK